MLHCCTVPEAWNQEAELVIGISTDILVGVSRGIRDTSETQLVRSEHNIVKRESSSWVDNQQTQRLDQRESMKSECVEETENSVLFVSTLVTFHGDQRPSRGSVESSRWSTTLPTTSSSERILSRNLQLYKSMPLLYDNGTKATTVYPSASPRRTKILRQRPRNPKRPPSLVPSLESTLPEMQLLSRL